MRFYSKKFHNARYVLENRDRIVWPGKGQQRIIGVTAQFRRHYFDSEAAQKELGWTDEQRIAVERMLLEHKDFGGRASHIRNNIYLATDGTVDVNTDVPEYLADLRDHVAERLGLSRGDVACAHTVIDDKGPRRCKNKATVGDFCTKHADASAELEPVT